MANVIKVERELFEKNGKSYYAYYINGVVRGIEVKVQVIPPCITAKWKRNLQSCLSSLRQTTDTL